MKLDKLAPKYAVQLHRACKHIAVLGIPGFRGSDADVDTTDFKAIVVDKVKCEGYQQEFYSHTKFGQKLCEAVIHFNGESWSFFFAERDLAHFCSLGKPNTSPMDVYKWSQQPQTDLLLKRTGLTTKISQPRRKNTVH